MKDDEEKNLGNFIIIDFDTVFPCEKPKKDIKDQEKKDILSFGANYLFGHYKYIDIWQFFFVVDLISDIWDEETTKELKKFLDESLNDMWQKELDEKVVELMKNDLKNICRKIDDKLTAKEEIEPPTKKKRISE